MGRDGGATARSTVHNGGIRVLLAALAVLLATPVAAEPPPRATAEDAAPAAVPAPACRRVVVGRGLERRVVYRCDEPIVVTSGAPTPGVVIAHPDPRKVVGRPRSDDRLDGLSRRFR
jgi:hypothetical protein